MPTRLQEVREGMVKTIEYFNYFLYVTMIVMYYYYQTVVLRTMILVCGSAESSSVKVDRELSQD